jgi:4-amino-4-deoxy-L-arabinose transferase-like glycosyltransferase
MTKGGRATHQRVERLLIHHLAWWALIAILLFAAGVRYRLLDVPLERDEGEYAYAGQLLLQGVPPYKQVYNMKLPGIYAAYAAMLAVFGQTHTGIHLGLLVINAATTILIFMLAKRVIDPLAGVAAAACFAVLSLTPSVQGLFANAEHFVILPAVGGLLLLLRALDEDRPWLLFSSGLLLGLSFLMKQQGAAFIAFGGLYILIEQLRKSPLRLLPLTSRCALFAMGAVVPYVLTCLLLASAGVFGKFWFWTVDYAMAYTSQVSVDHAWANFKRYGGFVAKSAPLIWTLAGLGLTATVWDERVRQWSIFIIAFTVFSFVAICPGFYFRKHYFVLTLPAASLLAGSAISAVANMLSNVRSSVIRSGLPIFLVVTYPAVSVYQWRFFLFQMTPVQVCRATYGLNPFPESLEVSRFIQEQTEEDDLIAVIGSEPQIYFYSGRRSATGYIYMYPLLENHTFVMQMHKEMIQEVESAQPKFLVFVQTKAWLRRPDVPLLEWYQRYQAKHYTLVGLVDLANDKALYYWTPNVKWPPRSSHWIAVLKRNT